jgi:hypothetical protein
MKLFLLMSLALVVVSFFSTIGAVPRQEPATGDEGNAFGHLLPTEFEDTSSAPQTNPKNAPSSPISGNFHAAESMA